MTRLWFDYKRFCSDLLRISRGVRTRIQEAYLQVYSCSEFMAPRERLWASFQLFIYFTIGGLTLTFTSQKKKKEKRNGVYQYMSNFALIATKASYYPNTLYRPRDLHQSSPYPHSCADPITSNNWSSRYLSSSNPTSSSAFSTPHTSAFRRQRQT